MLSSTSRFARLAERASYFSPPPPPPPPPPSPGLSLSTSTGQALLTTILSCISLRIYHSFFSLSRRRERELQSLPPLPWPHPEISSALAGFLRHAPLDMSVATRESSFVPNEFRLETFRADWNVSPDVCYVLGYYRATVLRSVNAICHFTSGGHRPSLGVVHTRSDFSFLFFRFFFLFLATRVMVVVFLFFFFQLFQEEETLYDARFRYVRFDVCVYCL